MIETSDATRPSFVFAFPSSTHSPYDFGPYRGSDLSDRSDSTIVVVLDDHLPPLSAGALGAFSLRIARSSEAERTLAARALLDDYWLTEYAALFGNPR